MNFLHRSLLPLMLLAASAGAHSATKIPLESGTYIEGSADMNCAESANAGTLYFNGRTLQGPHLETCTTAFHAVGSDGKTFETQSICDEQDKSGQRMKQKELRNIKIDDRTHFRELMADSTTRDFHRCGPYPQH